MIGIIGPIYTHLPIFLPAVFHAYFHRPSKVPSLNKTSTYALSFQHVQGHPDRPRDPPPRSICDTLFDETYLVLKGLFMADKRARGVLQLLLVWAVLTALFAEIGTRLFVRLPLQYHDEKTTCYRFDEELGWHPKESAQCVHSASVDTAITHNSDGLRDQEPEELRSKPSIAFFGDSFVWGYDVVSEERFTNDIQAFLPGWSIYNFGVSGYGTDQEYLLLKRWYPKYRPDIVYFVVHTNDHGDNATNYRDSYYKPYFVLNDGVLELNGTPAAKSFRYQQVQHPLAFRSALVQGLAVVYNRFTKPGKVKVPSLQLELLIAARDYVVERGSEFRVVFTYADDNQQENDELAAQNIAFLHLPTKLKFEKYGQHWTEEGHAYIAAKILEDLYREGRITDNDLNKAPRLQ